LVLDTASRSTKRQDLLGIWGDMVPLPPTDYAFASS